MMSRLQVMPRNTTNGWGKLMRVSSQLVVAGGKAFSGLKRLGLFNDPLSKWLFAKLFEHYKLAIESRAIVHAMKLIAPGSTVVDVGANVGILTLPFAKRVGPTGKVVAIEPDPSNLDLLRKRLKAAKFLDRVHVYPGVASNKIGHEQVVFKPLEPWDHHIGANGTWVDATTVDALVARLQLPEVSFIKIDVQGAELLVLNGMNELLRQPRIAICVEIHPESLENFGTRVDALLQFMQSFHYKMYHPSSRGFIELTEHDVFNILRRYRYTDIVFRHAIATD